jgi:hypothetical protein
MTAPEAVPCGYAATAAEFLDPAAGDLARRGAGGVAGRQLAAMVGTGYALLGVIDQLGDGVDAAAARNEHLASLASAAEGDLCPPQGPTGLVLPVPGGPGLAAGGAGVVRRALADAIAWHAAHGDCRPGCGGSGNCPDQGRHEAVIAQYAALLARLDGDAW